MRIGIENFNSERLAQAINARGITQTQLASESGISAATISNWVNNIQLPEFSSLQKVALALNIPTNWFVKKSSNYQDEAYYFRALSAATKTSRNMTKSMLEWSYDITSLFESWIDLPDVNIPSFENTKDFNLLTTTEIEDIATQCRNYWKLGIGPISNLIDHLETIGIIVIRGEIGQIKMDGVSKWFNDRPYIFLVADKANAARSRFDAAHELGHIILHRHVSPDCYTKNTESYKKIESQANDFASAFLMPSESIAIELASPTLNDLILLKRKWKVSIAALIYRAHKLNLISEEYSTRLWKNYSARGWRKGEPFDDVILPEKPSILKDSINLLIQEAGFTPDYIKEEIGLGEADISLICGLPSFFFRKEKPKIINIKDI